MTSILPPLHMYAPSAIHFRDPFASQDSYQDRPRPSWTSQPQYPDFTRAFTPPPEMNGVSHAKAGYYQQEHGHHYGDYLPDQQAYTAPVAPHMPQELSHGQNGRRTQVSGRTSPAPVVRQPVAGDGYAQSRRTSQANAIAPSFQIPKSVNDSGGSLSELAAQVRIIMQWCL